MKLFSRKTKVTSIGYLLLVFTMTGCSIQQSVINPYYSSLQLDKMYLRGTFNWWGVQESYRFTKMSSTSWYTQIFLLADGTYDFKIADGNWSPQQNCGSLNSKIAVDEKVESKLFCNLDSQNLQFTPKVDGNFRFIVQENNGIYKLTISIVN